MFIAGLSDLSEYCLTGASRESVRRRELRERTGFPIILYGLYLVFLGLSFGRV
ncbi:MAG: hypothetical protein QW756_00665 [Nitrososphaerota archaeon]